MNLFKNLTFVFFLFATSVQAENMIMARLSSNFNDSMILVKEKLNEYGYKIAHIQKCDGGLSDFGYKTDYYKSIFFGKFEEMRHLTQTHPEIIPFVPLKIAVMQEKETTLIVATNPVTLTEFFPDKSLQMQFWRWESDIRAIFDEVAKADKL